MIDYTAPGALISSISGHYYLGNDKELELAKKIISELVEVTAQRDNLLTERDELLTEIENLKTATDNFKSGTSFGWYP